MAKFLSISWLAIAFIGATLLQPKTAEQITLDVAISGCGATLHLYQFDGFGFTLVQSADSSAQNFRFTLPESGPEFYYLGPSDRNAVPIILGSEQKVSVRGNCQQLRQMEIINSPINDGYRALKEKMAKMNQETVTLSRNIQENRGDEAKKEEFLQRLKALDEERLAFLNNLKEENPFFGSIVSLNTYPSFLLNGQEYDNELGYYADNFFQFADFKNEIYAKIPWTYESFKGYTNTLSMMDLSDDAHKLYLDKALHLIPDGSAAQRLAYAGVLSALKEKTHPNFVYFADQFIEIFKAIDPATTGRLKKELDVSRNLMVGGLAPDFIQETPEGEPLSLSALRGKVVLIDFWASWCGPCRRENPNVVRVYQKYKEKGFEILSVSLDNQKDRWLQAIEKDGLEWQHVSDLKGWQNEVAQTYEVHSIPQTILLDAEGKIVAKNLRGAGLEQKLAEIFEQ